MAATIREIEEIGLQAADLMDSRQTYCAHCLEQMQGQTA